MGVISPTLTGALCGFLLGIPFSILIIFITKFQFPSTILSYIDDRNTALRTEASVNRTWAYDKIDEANNCTVVSHNTTSETFVARTRPKDVGRLPPGIVVSESDLYQRRLWGHPNEDLPIKLKYLVTFTVGYEQKDNINAVVKKFSENFTILLFHYDGRASEWDEFEWSKKAIHVSARKQTKWWYAKRFLHPDIVAPYEYIFIWDEDLGVEHFDAEEYIRLVKKHGMEISQPRVESKKDFAWLMTQRQNHSEVHKEVKEREGWCTDPHLPPCTGFVEIMAPVFSRNAWRCVWHLIQNDLVHGWGLDHFLHKCVQPANEKMGVTDAQWIVHQVVPSLRAQGKAKNGKNTGQRVRDRCGEELEMFQARMAEAEQAYNMTMGIVPHTSTNV